MNTKINLLVFLKAIDDYIVIKKSDEFPNYLPGSDIDLVVFNKENIIKRAYKYYNKFITEEAELRIHNSSKHCHIDFLFSGTLDLRIDLIDNFAFFTKFSVNSSYLVKLFKDRKKLYFHDDSYIYIPSPEDDLTLRYFEYLEYFYSRPDKIKHLDYITDIKDKNLKQKFFSNTHQYIKFKRKTWDYSKNVSNRIISTPFKPKSRRESLNIIIYNIGYLIKSTIKKFKNIAKK